MPPLVMTIMKKMMATRARHLRNENQNSTSPYSFTGQTLTKTMMTRNIVIHAASGTLYDVSQ